MSESRCGREEASVRKHSCGWRRLACDRLNVQRGEGGILAVWGWEEKEECVWWVGWQEFDGFRFQRR